MPNFLSPLFETSWTQVAVGFMHISQGIRCQCYGALPLWVGVFFFMGYNGVLVSFDSTHNHLPSMAMVTRLPGSECLPLSVIGRAHRRDVTYTLCLLAIPLSDVGLGGHDSEILHPHMRR